MKYKDLKLGDEFKHNSNLKIPTILKVGRISITPKKRRVHIHPEVPYSDFVFTFEPEQNTK